MNMKQYVMTLMAVAMALLATAQTNRIYIEDFEIHPDSTAVVPVMLANEEPTRGLQFCMTLPEGLELMKYEMTALAKEYEMQSISSFIDGVWTLGMYPMDRVCLPPDTVAVYMLTFAAAPEFKGGQIRVWKCRGSTIDNVTIWMGDDTTTVTVPTSALVGIPVDSQQDLDMYFNLMGQPISSPDSVPVAIEVTTRPDGIQTSRKVAKSR